MLAFLLQGLVEYGAAQPATASRPPGSAPPTGLEDIWRYLVDEPAIALLGLVTLVMIWAFFQTRPWRL